ncbi:hypothetical protein GTY54_11465 [Streptomyces sp. SID625]|nr:hypothetical protein [Streptomyces sp. SID625]
MKKKALGVLARLTAAWAVGAGERWARPAATAMFLIGAAVTLSLSRTCRPLSGHKRLLRRTT